MKRSLYAALRWGAAIAQMYMCLCAPAHALLAVLSADSQISTFMQLVRTGGLDRRYLNDAALQVRWHM
jgi:hypothetical protein